MMWEFGNYWMLILFASIFGSFLVWPIDSLFYKFAVLGKLEFLNDPATGNLFLLLASLIGVIGSFLLYIKRRRDRRRKLTQALLTELEGMENMDNSADTLSSLSEKPPESRVSPSKVPPAESFPTTVFDNNTSELGLLSEDDLAATVNFYTALHKHKAIIRGIRTNPEGVPMPDHEALVEDFPDLPSQRKKLLERLRGY
ncbi:hypothetical protein [Halodesulfurarchaeum sp.]|uniref:hypothetical protein n=1 Tax=Halodesulfurarchaeum sp. TaxID=1980530 RepID=UPI002FC2E5FD